MTFNISARRLYRLVLPMQNRMIQFRADRNGYSRLIFKINYELIIMMWQPRRIHVVTGFLK